ncbi:twin-arginine translocation signal domain-containing protein [Streptomyces avermitilis]|uniref:twin-arginine translocation signal domain-containing protein n=1 Tax=Streptomyces avermitilis TaxID=33903 RepID=UPI001F1B1DD8
MSRRNLLRGTAVGAGAVTLPDGSHARVLEGTVWPKRGPGRDSCPVPQLNRA